MGRFELRLQATQHRRDATGSPVDADVCARVSPATAITAPVNSSAISSELVRGVMIALGTLAPAECSSFDRNADDHVTIDELIKAVSAALTPCPNHQEIAAHP